MSGCVAVARASRLPSSTARSLYSVGIVDSSAPYAREICRQTEPSSARPSDEPGVAPMKRTTVSAPAMLSSRSLGGLREQRGFARAGIAEHGQRLRLVPCQVRRDRLQGRRSTDEVAASLGPERLVASDLPGGLLEGLELVELAHDHPGEAAPGVQAERVRPVVILEQLQARFEGRRQLAEVVGRDGGARPRRLVVGDVGAEHRSKPAFLELDEAVVGIDVEHEAGVGLLAVDEGPRAAIRRQPLGQRSALGGRDRAEEAEDVLACVRHLEGASHDLMLGRRGDVLRPGGGRPPASRAGRSPRRGWPAGGAPSCCHAAASASWAAFRSSVLAPSDRSSSRGRRQYSAGTALSSRRYQPFAPSGRSSHASSGRSSSGTTARISSSSSASTRAGSGRQPYRSPSRTRKFGLGVTRWQRAISSRQIAIARWSRPASSLTPQRRSIAWKRAPRAAQSSSSRGKTCAWSRLRSSLKSSKVELTKTRKVRLAWRGSPIIA